MLIRRHKGRVACSTGEVKGSKRTESRLNLAWNGIFHEKARYSLNFRKGEGIQIRFILDIGLSVVFSRDGSFRPKRNGWNDYALKSKKRKT